MEMRRRTVAEIVAEALAAEGAEAVFGVLGSGNLVVTNALVAQRVTFVAARHEGGAACMADGWARVTGGVGLASVHQGPGLTNAMTGIAEAVKSRTPMVVVAADTPAAAIHSNFRIDQRALVESVGAAAITIDDPDTAQGLAKHAMRRAVHERRPVVLMLPLDVQGAAADAVQLRTFSASGVSTFDISTSLDPEPPPPRPRADPALVVRAAELLRAARRPVIVGGRGAVVADAGEALALLGERCGALLATSAPAHGLFAGEPFALGIAGGFSSPLAQELLPQADLVLAVGATLNHWTTRHGTLFGDAPVIQIDDDPAALGVHGPRAVAIAGDAAETARALLAALDAPAAAAPAPGWRTPELAATIRTRRWADEPPEAAVARSGTPAGGPFADPRALTIALDGILPADRVVAVDSGHFLGWPAMFLPVQDARRWVFPNGFQAVGLGLGCAIGAAVALRQQARWREREPPVTVAALGDGGCFMALPELETAVRLSLKLLVVVYDDAAYGAEVHHFAPSGHEVGGAQFPDADLAALGRAAGAQAITVRAVEELAPVASWLAEGAPGPLVVDAKVDPTVCAAWLEDAFRGG